MNLCPTCGQATTEQSKPQPNKTGGNTGDFSRFDGHPLTDWEKTFIESVRKQHYAPTPKQQVILNKMAAKYLPVPGRTVDKTSHGQAGKEPPPGRPVMTSDDLPPPNDDDIPF